MVVPPFRSSSPGVPLSSKGASNFRLHLYPSYFSAHYLPGQRFLSPGAIGGSFLVDALGSKTTMIAGLLTQAVVGFIMSGLYGKQTNHFGAFAVIYGIFLSLRELGPGNNVGLLAAKSGPTAVRGQYYGIAAAVGKVGAFVGTWAFPPIIKAFGGADTTRGNTGPFWIGSALALLSALITLLFVRPLTTDGMAKEDEEFRAYLEANGYDVSQMGLRSEATTMVDDVTSEKEEGSV